MDMEKIICHCHDVSAKQIKEAMDQGATTLEEVQAATEAGTGCGGCIDDIEELMAELSTE